LMRVALCIDEKNCARIPIAQERRRFMVVDRARDRDMNVSARDAFSAMMRRPDAARNIFQFLATYEPLSLLWE